MSQATLQCQTSLLENIEHNIMNYLAIISSLQLEVTCINTGGEMNSIKHIAISLICTKSSLYNISIGYSSRCVCSLWNWLTWSFRIEFHMFDRRRWGKNIIWPAAFSKSLYCLNMLNYVCCTTYLTGSTLWPLQSDAVNVSHSSVQSCFNETSLNKVLEQYRTLVGRKLEHLAADLQDSICKVEDGPTNTNTTCG